MAKTPEQKAAEAAAKAAAVTTPVVVATTPEVQETPIVLDSIQDALTPPVIETPVMVPPATVMMTPPTHVPFTADQMEVIQQMVAASQKRGINEPISVYGQRDNRVPTQVKVSQFEGKFVTGFKNLQLNSFKKEPKYSVMKPGYMGKATLEPHVILILSEDGNTFVEKEVALVDFMDNRDRVEVPIIHIEKLEVIRDHGVLGRRSGEFGVAIDENNRPLAQVSLKAESKEVITKYYVQIPGFAHPVEFIGDDFLA